MTAIDTQATFDMVAQLRAGNHPSCREAHRHDVGFPPCPSCGERLTAADTIEALQRDRLRLIAVIDQYLCECGDAMPAPDAYECPNCATARWAVGNA